MKLFSWFITAVALSLPVLVDNKDSGGGGADPIFNLVLQIERIDRILSEDSAILRNGFDIDSGRSIREMIEIERAERSDRLNQLTSLRADVNEHEPSFLSLLL